MSDKLGHNLEKQMKIPDAPEGWRFCAADFSVQAAGGGQPGRVMLVREPDAKAAWHALPDEVKESEDGPALYVCGWGVTFAAAMEDATKKALSAAPLAA